MTRKLVHRPRVRYHRNGVGGAGFHVVRFDDHSKPICADRLVAYVFDQPGHVAVVNPDLPLVAYRGDLYEPELRAAIAAAPGSEVFGYKEEGV